VTDLPRTASTIVVGGGIVGAAAAFFLSDRGESDVLVLERGTLGSGTSSGGLGGIRHQFEDHLDVRLSQLATAFWRNFEDRTGSRHDFHERGYLFIANSAIGIAELRRPLPLYERLGVPVRMVDRGEIAALVPGIRVDDVFGGRFCVRDGYGDPLVALAGFAAAAQLGGATFRERTEVVSLIRDGDRVSGVRTSAGDVRAERVLIATGCWTATLAATAGVAVPIWPYRRSIMESSPVPALAEIPLTIEWESGFHFRPKGGGEGSRPRAGDLPR
jgi:sarcosine oxidase subunit beta